MAEWNSILPRLAFDQFDPVDSLGAKPRPKLYHMGHVLMGPLAQKTGVFCRESTFSLIRNVRFL